MHILVFGVYHSMFLNQVVILCLENKFSKLVPNWDKNEIKESVSAWHIIGMQ